MKIQSIRKIAKEQGIRTEKLGLTELIHAIQLAEGNFNCFGSAVNGYCDQSECLWKDDCVIT